jgi:hypothetical protein
MDILLSCQSYFWAKFKIHINPEDVISQSRESHIIFERALVCLYLRNRGMSLWDIAIVINREAHATVINLLKYDTKREGRDPRYRMVADNLTRELSAYESDKKIKWHRQQIEILEAEYKAQFGRDYRPITNSTSNKDAALAYLATGQRHNTIPKPNWINPNPPQCK